MKNRPGVNSGWYHVFDPDYGGVWSSWNGTKDCIVVRKILFSKRKPKRRKHYQHDSTEPKRFMKCGAYYEYMKDEWGVDKMVNGMLECPFRQFIQNRWRDDECK